MHYRNARKCDTAIPSNSEWIPGQSIQPVPTKHLTFIRQVFFAVWHGDCLRKTAVRYMSVKIAIPSFGTRVSPRFDCAQAIEVVHVVQGKPAVRETLASAGWTPRERIERLTQLEVDTVLCGGIDCWSVGSLQAVGVTVYGWVAGELEDALAALLRGDFDADTVQPGGRRWGCRRFAGGCPDGPRRAAGQERQGRGRQRGRRGRPGPVSGQRP
jgi:predicted Fe-Mo cluster-binding NifX family protein